MQGDPRYLPNYQSLPISSTRHPLISLSLYTYTSWIMANRSRFVTCRVQKYGLTHFLTIPLVTPTSRPQIRDSFKCLWDDLTAIDVPTDAIRPLGLLHLNLGTSLSLKTPEHMDKAIDILKKLSFKEALPTMHESSTSWNLSRHSSSLLPTSNYNTNNSMAPPSVSISSLFCTPGKEAVALRLTANVYDATHRVRDWKVRLAHAYQAAGLSPKPKGTYDPQVRAAMNEILDSYDSTVRLVKIPDSTKATPCKWKPGKLINECLPSIDARGLLERYKDHVWIENAPLERVSICKMGLHRPGLEELPEVFSVPLS